MLERRPTVATLLLVVFASLGGCNALTGAADLAVGDDGADDGDGGHVTGSGQGTGSSVGGSGSGATSASGASGSVGSGEQPHPDQTVDAAGVSITEIAAYQGVKRPLMQNGSPTNG